MYISFFFNIEKLVCYIPFKARCIKQYMYYNQLFTLLESTSCLNIILVVINVTKVKISLYLKEQLSFLGFFFKDKLNNSLSSRVFVFIDILYFNQGRVISLSIRMNEKY